MSCWPGPCCRPPARKRSTGAPGKSAQRKDRQVSRVYSSQPSWVAVGPLGKVQLVTGFGALVSGAGGNKHFAPFLPLLEKLRFTCVTSHECIGGSYCSVLRSQFSRLLWPLFEPLGASCCRLSLWELASIHVTSAWIFLVWDLLPTPALALYCPSRYGAHSEVSSFWLRPPREGGGVPLRLKAKFQGMMLFCL